MEYVDDACQQLLDNPDIDSIPLQDWLGARLTAEQADAVDTAVAGRRRVQMTLQGEQVLELLLAPTPVEDFWVGSLRGRDDDALRIEGAMLQPGPPTAAPGHSLAKPNSVVAKVLDSTPLLIGIRDELGRYVFVNTALAEFFDKPAEEFLGRTPEQLGIAAASRLEWPDERPTGDARPWVVRDVALVDSQGRRRHFDIVRRAVRSLESGGVFMLEVGTEIALRGTPLPGTATELYERLAESEQRLELALSNGGLALLDWDVETGAIRRSPQLEQLLELAEGARIESFEQLRRFEHPQDRARVDGELTAQLDGRSAELQCEYRIRTARGRTRWVLANGRVVERGPDGRALRYVATLRDVTELIETEQELRKQLARVEAIGRKSAQLENEIKTLEAQIKEISHREQERIGRDLHDGLAQELTGASLLLKTLEHAVEQQAPALVPRVRAVRDMVDQCIGTTRALAHALAAVHLDRDGFAAALEDLAANSEALYGIPVRFAASGVGPAPRRDVITDLYRITQEAIRNAAKHSGAREISVALDIGPDRLVVTIEDDGCGIPRGNTRRGGMGLKIMRYRASVIGASLEIAARRGGGTTVRCTLENIGHSGEQGGGKL